jgi:flavin-dependent dehydrogenase
MSALDADRPQVDVAVVGGSIAGLATAIRFSQLGHRVAVFERKAMNDDTYKRLCTHFMQPNGVRLLARLGLSHLREPASSVTTKAVYVTPGGLIEGPGAYLPDEPDSYALNLERRVLDPALRAAARQQGVLFLDGSTVEGIEEDDCGWVLETQGEAGSRPFQAQLVVAADGRRSSLAKQLGNPAESHPNDRACLFGYFSGIDAPAGNRSIFIMRDRDLACVYPLTGGRTLLVLFAEKSRVVGWGSREDRLDQFLSYFDELPESPSMSDADPLSELLGYSDHPSLIRQPVLESVPFVGDAALSLDPMSGVGCGFALVSADLLASSFTGRSLAKADLKAGLADYRQRYADAIGPHVQGICADALIGKNGAFRQRMFKTISDSPELSQKYLAITGRLLPPDEFNQDLMRAMLTRVPARAAGDS